MPPRSKKRRRREIPLFEFAREWSQCPQMGAGNWTSRFGGIEWKFDGHGVYVRPGKGKRAVGPLRSVGEPLTCENIIREFGGLIIRYSVRFKIPPELIVMVIATESACYRHVGFAGPHTFRWEPHVLVQDEPPDFRGDYSLGPMQVLASTARWVIRLRRLDYDPSAVMPVYREEPQIPPEDIPAYDPEINLELGCAEIRQRWGRSKDNPILVSALYNTGGIYDASGPTSGYRNRWNIRSRGAHLDRAARWFGDACYLLSKLR